MKRKILFGSIAAVVLMVLASCSTVIGAENVKERPEVEEKNVEKIEQMVESIKEKVNMDKTDNPELSIWFPGVNIIGLIFFLIWFIVWILLGCPPIAPPVL